ncbi:amidohydrolase family protein [Cupriavidus basilensis]
MGDVSLHYPRHDHRRRLWSGRGAWHAPDVLRMFTINYADLNGEADTKGSIEKGKLADFVVLSGDYLTVPEVDIQNLHAIATYVGGRQVYRDAATSVPAF